MFAYFLVEVMACVSSAYMKPYVRYLATTSTEQNNLVVEGKPIDMSFLFYHKYIIRRISILIPPSIVVIDAVLVAARITAILASFSAG